MALIDKASLLMVPSTYEAGKLYNVLPSGNRAPDSTDQNSGYDQTRADFDFDRGTDHAATRIDENGVLQKYRENTAERSNTFNQWANKTRISFTSGQEDKDGGTDAWLAECTADGQSYFYNTPTTNTGIRTRSVYAKAGTASSITFLWDSFNQNEFATFNLVSGTFTNAGCLADMEDVGNGWYRCITTITDASNTYAMLLSLSGKTGNSVTDGDNVYIMHAQQEAGLVATDYLESTSVTGKAGVLVDLPRINYDANGENGSLLLEPSRANLIRYSEYFDTDWVKSNATITTNNATSPEGVDNASLITISAALGNIYDPQGGSGDYVFSVYAKYVDMQYIRLRSTGSYVYFDIQNGSVETEINGTGYIEDAGNGWYKCSVVGNNTNTLVQIYLSDTEGAGNPTGTGSALIYGSQFEAGSYSTSYIPNNGESGGVTRAADSCSVTGASDVIGQTEGTIFWDVQIDTPVATANEALFNIDAGAFGNTIYLIKGGTGNITGEMYVSSAAQASFTLSGISAGNYKIAFAYAQNNTAMFVNGVQVGATDTSCNVPAMSRIQLGNGVFGPSTDKTKQATLFKERLSNAELATLTTL